MTIGADVRRVFHLTAVVHDRDAVVAEWRGLLGASVIDTAEGDTFGVEMRRAMVWLGDNLVEVIEPVGDSPFARFLARFGGGLNALGLQVDDVRATEARLAADGIEVAVRYGDDMIATRTANTAGLALQITSQWVPGDPRQEAAARPPVDPSAAVAAQRLAFVGAVVDDPVVAAARLARVFGNWSATFEPTDLPGPEAAVGLGDCALALYRTSPSDTAVWGRVQDRPRFLALGVEVADAAAALDAIAARIPGPPVAHRSGPLVILASGVPITLCGELLPGDPRRA